MTGGRELDDDWLIRATQATIDADAKADRGEQSGWGTVAAHLVGLVEEAIGDYRSRIGSEAV